MVEFPEYDKTDENRSRSAHGTFRAKHANEYSRSAQHRGDASRQAEDKLDGPLSSLLGREGRETDGWT